MGSVRMPYAHVYASEKNNDIGGSASAGDSDFWCDLGVLIDHPLLNSLDDGLSKCTGIFLVLLCLI